MSYLFNVIERIMSEYLLQHLMDNFIKEVTFSINKSLPFAKFCIIDYNKIVKMM